MNRIAAITLTLSLIIAACATPPSTEPAMVPTFTPIPATSTETPRPTKPPRPTETPRPTATEDPTRPISWEELQVFLAQDHTNWGEWTPGYRCLEFACELLANAREAGIRSDLVTVSWVSPDEEGHAFVQFETTDKGAVWVEPQIDYGYTPADRGGFLCLTVDPSQCFKSVISAVWIWPGQEAELCPQWGE